MECLSDFNTRKPHLKIPLDNLTNQLTPYKPASLKEVAYLSFSFILVLFSASLMGFCDRLILARHAIEGLEASVTALWLAQLFQVPFMRAASMTQVFVGQYKGAGQLEKIGPCVWQMIWFSLATVLFAWPLSQTIGALFFHQLNLQQGVQCFHYLMIASFLFPLGSVLAAFYLGQGHTGRVIAVSLTSHCLHILLDFPLVYGITGLIPPLGALGSTLASIVAQFFFCACLLIDFLSSKYRDTYAVNHYAFKWSLAWKYIRLSLPRAIARIIHLSAWVMISRMMVVKGENYAAVVAFGGSLQMLLSCLNEGLAQALTTIGAYLIGSKKPLIWRAVRSGCLFLILEGLVFMIPLFIFPEKVIALFFKRDLSLALNGVLTLSCLWIWLGFFGEGLNIIGFALLSAFGDTIFLMYFAIAAWILGFLPCYLLIQLGDAPPYTLWLVIACATLIVGGFYLIRLIRCQSKASHRWANRDLSSSV